MARFSTVKFCFFCLISLTVVISWRLLQCIQYQNLSKRDVSEGHQFISNDRKFGEDEKNWPNHTLAVVIPFRDRFEELQEFAPHIHTFLNQQKIHHKIYVVNQVDHFRFNRAALINVGYLLSREECDYIVMHDVDLLPQNLELLYDYPEKGPYHLASPEYHPLYHYKNFIGGVLMMTNKHFEMCKGMSNLFWGWGREDDELYVRFRKNNLKLHRPTGLTSGYETFKHIHDRRNRPRDYNRDDYKEKMKLKDGGRTGYHNINYELLSSHAIVIDEAPIQILNVALKCESEEEKRWCEKPLTKKPVQAAVKKDDAAKRG